MIEERAQILAALPWTYLGPVEVVQDDQVWFELRIQELPDFFLATETREELFREVRPALVSFVASYIEHEETLPLPPVRWLFGWKDSDHKPVKGEVPTPAPGTVWNDKVPGVSGNMQTAVA